MKGNCALFPSNNSNQNIDELTNGTDYNTANSSSVKKVDIVEYISEHKVPEKGTPNSVKQNYDSSGKLTTERYYDDNGNPYLDIDYTDHGNPKTHPNVPHQHEITINEDGKMHRGKEEKIK